MVFLGIIGFFASKIKLEEDVTSLIPSGEKQNVLKKVLNQSRLTDKIIVTISSEDREDTPEDLIKYASRFIDSVNTKLPTYVKNVQGKVPDEGIREIYNFVYNHLPLFLNEADYQKIEQRLETDSVSQLLKEDYKTLISPTGLVTREFLFKDPLALTPLGLDKLQELQVGDNFVLYNNFLFTKDHQHLLLFINPELPSSETDKNTVFIQQLDSITASLNNTFPKVKGEYFGGVLYSLANANQIKKDIRITVSIAVFILLILLVLYYRKIYVPLLLFIPSIIGAVTAIAVLYFLEGTISAISIGIGSILLGISIDYALHILTHYKNNYDLKQLYKDITVPVLMSSGTTAIAFLCLLFVKSKALNDLGIFAAISVLVASIVALLLTPLLYKAPATNSIERNTFLDKFAAIEFHKKKYLVILLALLFTGGLFFFTHVKFNSDLSSINYVPANIKNVEKKVQDIAGQAAKSVYLVSYGNTPDDALEANNKLYTQLTALKNKGEVTSFSSIGGVVLSTTTQLNKIEKWNSFWTAEKKEEIRSQLIKESSKYGFKPQSFNKFYSLLSKNFDPIYLKDYRQTSTLYLDDFISAKPQFATVTTSLEIPEGNTEQLIQKFRNEKNVVVVDRKQLNESFLGNLKTDFNHLIWYSIIAVFLILLISYRSLVLSMLTIVPIGITWVIALGVMGALHIEFNILNIIISTFIFGLGLDYSIFITNAFLKEYETGNKVLKTYRTSIILSVITTLLGIGALFFAEHPALKSISVVSIIGVLSAVTVAFVLQGYFFDVLFIERIKKGKPALNFKNLISFTGKNNGEKLYYRKEVLSNYRYKNVFAEVKKYFDANRERFLKVAGFIEDEEKVLHFYSECGALALFLHYKNKNKVIGLESNEKKVNISRNCFAVQYSDLQFYNKAPGDITGYKNIIISPAKSQYFQHTLSDLISKQAEKVIILDPGYNYRWIIDLNFEIVYRQNEVILLQKLK